MMEDPAVSVDAMRLTAVLREMESAQDAVDGLYARWAELTEKVG
jgi:ABC transport system ATP-binding/permease protein